MCFVRVILKQLVASIALQTLFVCLYNFLSLLRNCRELSKKGALLRLLSGRSQPILPHNGHTPFLFLPLSHSFMPCVLYCLAHPANPMLSIGILLHAYMVSFHPHINNCIIFLQCKKTFLLYHYCLCNCIRHSEVGVEDTEPHST